MWGAGLAIRYNDIFFERELGEGRYAKVYKANVYGTDVAVKVPKEDSARILELFKTEGQTLSRLQHENVCRWLGFSSTVDEQGKEAVLLVTEYLAGGKLQDAIDAHRNKTQPLSLFTRLRMARDIVRGMIFVHEQSLVHHDLKPENLMLDEHGRVKIVDFGFAQLKPREPQRGAPRGSFLWMAPELMTRQPYNHKSDVYSWGVILWQLLTGAHEPYDTYSDRNAFTQDVGERGVRPPVPPDLPAGIRTLLQEAWAQEPERRPSFLEINDRLNALLTELACPDEFARLFWRRHFAAQDRVPWREVVPALCATFGVPPPEEPGGRNLSADALPPNATPQMLHKARASALKDFMRLSPECSAMALEEFRRRDNIEKLSSLRTVLVERDPYASQEVVMLERWGKVSALFGPIVVQEPRLFLDRIRAVLRQRWYHGNLSREAACDALKGQPQGTFLVRMSTNPLHSAVLSLNTGRNINHVQIEYVQGRGFRLLGKEQHFPSVTALIEGYILSRVLIEPCPFASPFRSFQETDETVDDIGYYYQLGDDFLMADDDSDGIRAALMLAHGAPVAQLTLGLPTPERRQLGNPSDVISLKDWVTLLAYQSTGETEVAAHKVRLASRLAMYGFRERQVPMDFNCQFSAVADQVHQSAAGAPTLRQQAVHWLRQNAAQVLSSASTMCHTLSATTFDAYVTALAEGAWGDHLTLQVLAELLHSRIWVVSSVSAAQFLVCVDPLTPPAPDRHLALCHLYTRFYASLELAPPS